MPKRISRGDSAHRIGPVRYPLALIDCSVSILMVVNIPGAGFSIPKIGNAFACGAPTRSAMAKRMSRGDSAHRVGLVLYPQGLSDCSGAYQMGRTTLLRVHELRKLVTVLLVEPEPDEIFRLNNLIK